MEQTRRGRWLLAAAAGGVVLLSLLILGAVYTDQKYKISKIEFLFWDRDHDNEANLSPEEFADYVRACGGRVERNGTVLSARYDGWFEHRHWHVTMDNLPKENKSS